MLIVVNEPFMLNVVAPKRGTISLTENGKNAELGVSKSFITFQNLEPPRDVHAESGQRGRRRRCRRCCSRRRRRTLPIFFVAVSVAAYEGLGPGAPESALLAKPCQVLELIKDIRFILRTENQCYKTFYCRKLGGKLFQPSLMFAGKGGAYLNEAPFQCSTLG
jgi:hypothetical protein